jgi:hypothetical protein
MSSVSFDAAGVAAMLVSRNKQVQVTLPTSTATSSCNSGFRHALGQDLQEMNHFASSGVVTSSMETPSSIRSAAQIAEDRSVRLKSVLRAGRSFADVAPPRKKRTQLIETRVKFKVSVLDIMDKTCF